MELEFQVLVWHYSALSELTYLVKHRYAWSYLSLASWDSKSHLRQYLIGNVSYLSLNAWFLNMLMCPAMVSCSTFIVPAGLQPFA